MITQRSSVRSACRKCGRYVPVEELAMDNTYKMIVCRECIKNKNRAAEAEKKENAPAKEKPAGWDNEDDYLEKAFKAKTREVMTLKRTDAEHVRYQCQKCGYSFKYNFAKRSPQACPMCGTEIGKMKVV